MNSDARTVQKGLREDRDAFATDARIRAPRGKCTGTDDCAHSEAVGFSVSFDAVVAVVVVATVTYNLSVPTTPAHSSGWRPASSIATYPLHCVKTKTNVAFCTSTCDCAARGPALVRLRQTKKKLKKNIGIPLSLLLPRTAPRVPQVHSHYECLLGRHRGGYQLRDQFHGLLHVHFLPQPRAVTCGTDSETQVQVKVQHRAREGIPGRSGISSRYHRPHSSCLTNAFREKRAGWRRTMVGASGGPSSCEEMGGRDIEVEVERRGT